MDRSIASELTTLLQKLKIFSLVAVFLIAVIAVIVTLRAPETKSISETISSNGTWKAIVEDIDYMSVFTPPDYRIILEPETGWLRKLRRKEIFEASQMFVVAPPQMQWLDNTHLVIECDVLEKDVTKRVDSYSGIEISYR